MSSIARPTVLPRTIPVTLGGTIEFLSLAIFWTWNATFFAFVFVGLLPFIFVDLWRASAGGMISSSIMAATGVLILVPLVSVGLALTVFRSKPIALAGLFYGFEAPLMAATLIRFFLLQQLNPVMAVLVTAAGLGMVAYMAYLLKPDHGPNSIGLLRVVGSTLGLAVGLYLAVMLLFYVLPLAYWVGVAIQDIPREVVNVVRHQRDLRFVPFMLSAVALMFYSATILILMPPATLLLHGRSWLRSVRATGRRGSVVAAMTFAALAASTMAVARQPQHAAFAALAPMEQFVMGDVKSAAPGRVDLRGDEAVVRAGLVNAYLAPFRYVGATETSHLMEALYTSELGWSDESALRVQAAFDRVAAPALYEGQGLAVDQDRAAALYRAVFDVPLQEGERETVLAALRSTWAVDQAEAGLLDVNQQRVHLERQEIAVAEHGDWADVEVHDVYRNRTGERQEVFLYFSLPESAVVTGVWLGDSDDRTNRFEFQVAPRGAAQEVYRAQVRRSVDPALLEQIGPGMYRLRVFPIEEPPMVFNEEREKWALAPEAPAMHMWLTYKAFARDGAWPLPLVSEARNLFWDDATLRSVNGAAVTADGDTWTGSAALAATGPTEPMVHVHTFAGGVVEAAPLAEVPVVVPDGPLAVVVDRSGSMAGRADSVAREIDNLAALGVEADVYLTSPLLHPDEPSVTSLVEAGSAALASREFATYFGGASPAEILLQYGELRASDPDPTRYAAVIVLTDGAAFAAGDEQAPLSYPDAPLWFVHLDGQFPPGYDDATLEAMLASGGGVAASVEDALLRLEAAGAGAPTPIDGYAWRVRSSATVELAVEDGFAPLAARQLILERIRTEGEALKSPEVLDGIHALAVEQQIVTPYSSMIVLVNDDQREQLRRASEGARRFDRSVETGEEQLQNPADPFAVTGVPEPEEWLLILLGLAMAARLAAQRWWLRPARLGLRVRG